MANPLAKVIRYIATGGAITSSDVQSAIEQLESIVTGSNALVSAHKVRHQDGGSDEINVTGLSGLLADGQTPLSHKLSHQDGGSDEINVNGLSGLLADEQNAGKLKNLVIDITGLSTNFMLKYDGTKFIVTNSLTGMVITSLSGLLPDVQKAGWIYSAQINITGLADKWVLRYDTGTSKWVAQTFNHASDHESGGTDPIASLPTANQKLALAGSNGAPSGSNKYLTETDKSTNITPFLLTALEKAAADAANSPSASNPFATKLDLAIPVVNTANGSNSVQINPVAFLNTPGTHKKGTPITVDTYRKLLRYCNLYEKPIGVIDTPCTVQSFNSGNLIFDHSLGTITVTNGISTASILSFLNDNGSGFGVITLTTTPPTLLASGDKIVVTGANNPNNNGTYTIKSIAGNAITVTVAIPFTDAVAGGTATSNKYQVGSIIEFPDTDDNYNPFTIKSVNGLILTVSPVPTVNEITSMGSAVQYLPNGVVLCFGMMSLKDVPHDFYNPSNRQTTFGTSSTGSLYTSILDMSTWLIGEQYTSDIFFVFIRKNENTIYRSSISYNRLNSPPARITLLDASSNSIVVSLEALNGLNLDKNGEIYIFKSLNIGSGYSITLDASPSTIDGASSFTFNTSYTSITVVGTYNSITATSMWSII